MLRELVSCTCFCLALLPVTFTSQQIQVYRADFRISPEGGIFGATLSHDAKVFYAQQYLTADDQGRAGRHAVRISSWDIDRETIISTRLIPESQHEQTVPCRRTLIGQLSGDLYTCSGRTSILSLDGKSLATRRTLESLSEGVIRDFAIDEQHNRLYVLAEHEGGSLTLEMVSLDGAGSKKVSLPERGLAFSPLAYRAASDLLAVGFSRATGLGERTDINFYLGSSLTSERQVKGLPRIDGMLFVGSKLLAAPGYSGFGKQECILGVDSQTGATSREFCSGSTGVDFSLASVSNRYLVAGTGVNRPRLFSDIVESISSSLSIWNIDTHKLLKTIALPSGFTSALAGVTIVGTDTGCFVAYQSSGVSPDVIHACIADHATEGMKEP